jgi:hypothetical protein
MIERHWKGLCRREKATAYRDHLVDDTFKQLELLEGFLSARILTRETVEGIEFLVITIWRSLEDITRFSGNDIKKAVVPVFVQELMIGYDQIALHYEVLFPE